MRRLALTLILALVAAHAAAMSATPARDAPVATRLLERIRSDAPERYRAAFLLAQQEPAGTGGAQALAHLAYAADGGHLPAAWLLAKRRLLGGRVGGVEVARDVAAGCALLARVLDPAALEVRPELAPRGRMVDYGVTLRVALTTQAVAARLAAERCAM